MSSAGVVLHTAPVVVPISAEPIWGGAVAVAGGRVLAVGPVLELTGRFREARRRDWSGVMLPGLVNAATSLQLSTLTDLAAARPSVWQLPARVAERTAGWRSADWGEAARTGAFLALRSGTTSVADVVTDVAALTAVARTGLGGVSYLPVSDPTRTPWGADLGATLRGPAGGRRLGVTWTGWPDLDEPSMTRLHDLVGTTGAPVLLPVAETVEEVEYVALGTGRLAHPERPPGAGVGQGRSPVAALDELGWLGPGTHLTHAVHADTEDLTLLAARGVCVAVQVRANRLLRVGRAPLAAALRAGVPLALGTGPLTTTPSLNLLAEASAAAELARAQGYDEPDLARRLVVAATRGGADALGMPDAGRLEPGARADLAVFEAPADPDPYAGLLAARSGACVATVLAGRIVHRLG